jgi:lantibiotic modifying enzyme
MSDSPFPAPERALAAAAAIGFGIARRAIWSGDRCAWLEAVPVQPGQNPAVSAICGADVYGGTAGIGWFLAQAAARIPDPLLRRTARAALRQAAARAREHLAASPHGFYGGAAGIGAALVLAGLELADEEAVEAGRALLHEIPVGTDDPGATDIISGLSGDVLSFALAAAALGGDAPLLARAVQAADRLLDIADRDANGTLSWASIPDRRANLTGFGHGAAGIAHCLLVLDALAPDPRLRAAVAAAFAYEASLFDPQQANWPDFRILPGYPPDQSFFPVAWCHGAAGIVRSRLAADAAGGFDVAGDVAVGLQTTAREAERWFRTPGADFTLCHGVLGLVDALLDAARSGREEFGPLGSVIAEFATAQFHDAEQPWPSGLPTREELNGLMMGNAGIGHFYLRLADPTLPSLLAPGAAVTRR